jgi:hypothetical protein
MPHIGYVVVLGEHKKCGAPRRHFPFAAVVGAEAVGSVDLEGVILSLGWLAVLRHLTMHDMRLALKSQYPILFYALSFPPGRQISAP